MNNKEVHWKAVMLTSVELVYEGSRGEIEKRDQEKNVKIEKERGRESSHLGVILL